MNHKKIATLLRTKLASISGLPTIADENISFTPSTNTPYLREAVLFNETFNLGLSEGERQDGVYQIDVLVPKNTSKFKALEYCDLLRVGFARQARALIDGDTIINLEGCSVSPARVEGEYFAYSVSCRWTVVL